MRVLLVDDHELLRRALRGALHEAGLEVIAEASDGADAMALVESSVPDVVVMDLSMPTMSGIEATRQIRTVAPLTRILILTGSTEEHDVLEAILAGANGYLLKDSPAEELVAGIAAVACGEVVISSPIASRLLEQVRGTVSTRTGEDALRAALTEREMEVLRALAGGMENAEIAAQLFISPKTVKNHISNILEKLQLENRIQAAVHAVRAGIV
jgi:DNA-binding NarL/FixJ family response regulator